MITVQDKMPLEKDFDIEESVFKMQDYWATYTNQAGWKNYDEVTFLNDALYGIGIAINTPKYRLGKGFRHFVAHKLYKFAQLVAKEDFQLRLKGKVL